MLAVKSPALLVIVTDVAAAGLEVLAANVPFVHGAIWLAPRTVTTATSAFKLLPAHETVAVCEPDGGLITWKIMVRMVALVPESVPAVNVPATPPRLAATLVAPFALMATMIIAARLAPLPMMKGGVVTVVTPNRMPELTLLSYTTPADATVSKTALVCVSVPLTPVRVSV
jgi:hypothetical protein